MTRQSFSFNAKSAKLLQDERLAFLDGNGLCVWDLASNKREHIWSQKNGFSSLTTNFRRNIMAVAEYGLNPDIHIYDASLNLVHTFSDVCELDVTELFIDYSGQYLLVLTGCPNYDIRLCDLKEKAYVPMRNNQMPKDFKKIVSDPMNQNELLLMCSRRLLRCDLVSSFEVDPNNPDMVRPVFDIISEEIPIEVESDFTTAEYLPFKGLIAATEDGAIYHINMGSANKEVKHKLYCVEPIRSFMLTALHIVAFTGSCLHMFEINDENESIKIVQDNPTKEYPLGSEFDRMMYTQSMEYLVGMAKDGGLWKWPIKAEKQEENEVEDEIDGGRTSKRTDQITVTPSLISMFHNSKIVFCDELKSTQKLISASESGLVTVHDLESGKLRSFLKIDAIITCAHINSTGNLLILGSKNGCLRILDLTNTKEIRIIMCKKLHKSESIRVVRFSEDQTIIGFATENSNRLYLISGTPENHFELYGFVYLEGTVLDVSWASSAKAPIDSKKNKHLLEVTVKNGLVQAIVPLKGIAAHLVFEELGQEAISNLGRRIDSDITMAIVEPESGDIFCTGSEKILRRYKQPDEYIRDMDLRRKQQGMPTEYDSHDLITNCFVVKPSSDALVSGGLDGSVIKRSLKNSKDSLIKIDTQNHFFKGVSACSCSDTYPIVYSGGFDGSLLVHSYEEFEYAGGRDTFESVPAVADCSKLDALAVESDVDVKFYETILEEENRKAREDERYHTQKNMKEKLMSISNELKRLLLKNKDAQDIERIERDEFCLDLELRQKMLTEGDKNVDQIKKDAEFVNLKEELYHKKLTMLTYSKLDTHLKTITGLREPHLVTNFVIRKKEKSESYKYKLISNLRAVEIAEKQWRKDNKLYDPADLKGIMAPPEYYRDSRGANEKKDPVLEEFMLAYPDTKQVITKPENFICNLKQGKQKILLLDHAKREDERQKTIAAALEYDKGSDLKDAHMEAPDRPDPTGYRLHRISRNPKNKKRNAGAQVRDETMEEEKEDVNDHEADKDEEGQKDWEQMYGAFELFTSKRKKSQAIFLKNLVFKVKRAFNREFETYLKLRNKEIERISDLNLLIAEQMAKLNEINEPFIAVSNIIENPNLVLELGENEVGIERYLTKKEKKELEEKKLREEARIKEMQKNDANVRALKVMMNNTLEEKKESILTNEIVKEDWMEESNLEKMTDEQKIKYEDYKIRKQKFDEEAEKFRKKLEQDLKKLNEKIEEICSIFDNKLFILFTKRMEYQYKIYEQENYIIKLSQSIQSQKNFKNEIEKDKQWLQLIEDAIQENINYKSALERTRTIKHQETITTLDPAKLELLKSDRHDLRPQFENYTEKLTNERGAMKEYMEEKFKEFSGRNPELMRRLNEFDMFHEVENTSLRKMGVYDLEQYKQDIEENERYRNMTLKGGQTIYQRFNQIIEIEIKRRKQVSDVSKQESMINECHSTHEDLVERKNKMEENEDIHKEMLKQEHDNIYIQMRFLKRMVELPLQLSFQVLEKAVLVKDIEIHQQNKKIKTEGQAKITQLNEKLKIKNDVDGIKFDVLEKELEIEDLILESLAITRLKVTRQLQAAISNEKETEQEEKNLEEQIKTLKDTREKRIKDMEKKEKAMRKEIESIKVQNDTLRAEGAKLQDTVKERKKIFNMMQGKIGSDEMNEKEKEIEEENEGKNKKKSQLNEKCKDPQSFEKAQQIAFNRRLFDKAKKLAQEFELMMQELKKLKARTFPQIPAGRNNFL